MLALPLCLLPTDVCMCECVRVGVWGCVCVYWLGLPAYSTLICVCMCVCARVCVMCFVLQHLVYERGRERERERDRDRERQRAGN